MGTQPTAQPVQAYLRTQAIVCAAINIVVNPGLAWLTNLKREFVPLWDGMITDTTITLVVLPLLVTLFASAGVRRQLKVGCITPSPQMPRAGALLSRLPRHPWALGLTLGLGAVLLFLFPMIGVFHVLQVAGLSFAGFAFFKAVYCGLLAYVITRWAILRQLPVARPQEHCAVVS